MLTKKLFILAALSFSSIAAIAGCSAEVAEGGDETVEESEQDLSKAGKALIGSYKDDTGAFRGLILTSKKVGQGNEFIADVDTGIRCITAPCPSSERITGTFTAGTKTITFRSTTASSHVQHLLGRFNYLVQGDKLSLSRKGFAQSLEKVTSYCAQATDCYAQDIIHPMCLGSFSCTQENTCSWSCGVVVPPGVPCASLDEAACNAEPECQAEYGGSCPLCADYVFKGCINKPADPCAGLSQQACTANPSCEPIYGPSACTPDGRICTADMAYKGCKPGQSQGTVCLSSATCPAGQHCSTEDGVCNPVGMLAVCGGTCVN